MLYWVLGYWVIQGGYMGVLGSIKGYCGVLGSKRRYCGVLWVTMGYYRYCRYWGYWVMLRIKKDYCGVLHGSTGYYRVLGGAWVH